MIFNCNGHFNHQHRSEYWAKTCKHYQELFLIKYIDYWFMRLFKKKELDKILLQMKHKRALIRRIARDK